MPAGSGGGQPITAARFSLTVDGVEIAQFSELLGIASEAVSDDFASQILKRLPGKPKPARVILRRALTADTQIATWHDAAVAGGTGSAAKNAVLTIFAIDGTPVAKYDLANAWPAKLEIGAVEDGSSQMLFETVTVGCERLQRVAP
jgi:phage tail-like protein